MQSENSFDRFSKRVAIAVSRRSVLRTLSVAVTGACLPWTKAFGQDPPKRPAGPYPKTLTGFMESPDYQTVVLEKRLLKPGSSLSDPMKLKEFTPHCSYFVQITTAPGVTGGPPPFTQAFMCPAKDGVCPSMMDCKRAADRISQSGEGSKAYLVDSSMKPDAPRNKFDDKCKIGAILDPAKAMVFAFLNSDGNVSEEICVAPYSCEKIGKGTAWCPIQSEVVVAAGKEVQKKVCPQLNTCINEEIPRVQGYTQAELDAMPEDKRKETLRMLAEPAVPYKKPT
jgi:hypothetical protein